MIKTLKFGEKEVTFSTNFAWVFIYKSQFGKDAAKIIIPVVQDIYGGDTENAGFQFYEELGFTGIAEIAWSMAKLADNTVPDPVHWISGFGDDFDINAISTELLPDAIESMFTSKNQSAPVTRKKTSAKK